MKLIKLFALVLVSALVLTGFMGGQVAAQQATAQPTAAATAPAKFDINLVVQKYLTGLPNGFAGVGPADALKALQAEPKPYLVDVRDAKDFGDGGFIEGAVNIPLPTLTKSLDKLPAKDDPIIVYCAIGHRGGMALVTLQLLGYTNVKSISGGFNNWKTAKLPVAQGTPAAAKSTGAKPPAYDPELFAVLDKYISNLPAGYYGVAPADALKSFQATPKPFVVDVREASELTANGYIEGMVNIPIRTLYDNLSKLPAQKDAPIVVYCAIGHRGGIAMMNLHLLGYTNVKSIAGGFNGWVAAGLPIVKPAATAAATAAATK